MNKIKIKYVIDMGMLIAFISIFVTGLVKFPGLLGNIGINRGDLPMGDISRLHDWTGIALLALICLHLLLNWKWLVTMTRKYLKI